jgi:hypothetical protein
MTKTLFGGSESKSTKSSSGGYGALPADLQANFDLIAQEGQQLLQDPGQYFAPMGLTSEEQMAQMMMDPSNIEASISQYLNPFRDIITQDINTAYGDEYSALKQQADEAGAFGGSRYRGGQSDLERARLDAIASAQSDQYNQAYNQYQQGIGNLMGFGGLERGIDLGQSMALPTALSSYSNLINPLLGSTTSTGYSMSDEENGIFKSMDVGSAAAGAAAMFSDKNLKENIKEYDTKNGFKRYIFNYIGDSVRWLGVMAQEVKEQLPSAVVQADNGYYMVRYDKLGFKMERV